MPILNRKTVTSRARFLCLHKFFRWNLHTCSLWISILFRDYFFNGKKMHTFLREKKSLLNASQNRVQVIIKRLETWNLFCGKRWFIFCKVMKYRLKSKMVGRACKMKRERKIGSGWMQIISLIHFGFWPKSVPKFCWTSVVVCLFNGQKKNKLIRGIMLRTHSLTHRSKFLCDESISLNPNWAGLFKRFQ